MYYSDAKEVFDYQIEALKSAQQNIATNFDAAIDIILQSTGKIIMTGVGKSSIIAHKIAATLASTGTPAVYLNASEALHGDLGIISKNDVMLMLSKSGTTIELIKMLPTLSKFDVKTIGIFGNTQTPLAQSLDLVLDASVDREACPLNLAPMSSTTVALVIGDAIAAALMRKSNFQSEDFAIFHPAGQLGRNLLLTAADVMHKGDDLPILQKENSLKEVVIKMSEKNLGMLCICDKSGVLEGIITDGDVRRWLLTHDNLVGKAEELMTSNPTSLLPEMKLIELIGIMENPKRQIYVAPVIDEKGLCIGLVRMHDVLSR